MNNYLGNNFDFGNFIGKVTKNNDCCPDQIVGKMKGGITSRSPRQNIDYECTNNKPYIRNNVVDPIVIVLESPHKSEYVAPFGPAKGPTGVLFFNKFDSMIKKSSLGPLLQTGTHSVILMNAIQYQCSLGNPLNNCTNKTDRDNNWIKCFKGANDICLRLDAIKPFATINLCTEGYSNLNLMLDKLIHHYPNYTYGTHPSTWNFSYAKIK